MEYKLTYLRGLEVAELKEEDMPMVWFLWEFKNILRSYHNYNRNEGHNSYKIFY